MDGFKRHNNATTNLFKAITLCQICNDFFSFKDFFNHVPKCYHNYMVIKGSIPFCTCLQCRGNVIHPGDTVPQIVTNSNTKILQQQDLYQLMNNNEESKTQSVEHLQLKRERDETNKTQKNSKRRKTSDNQTNFSSTADVTDSIINPFGTLSIFPQEIFEKILSYFNFRTVGTLRRLNKYFYELTTGYNQVGLTGFQHKPNTNLNPTLLAQWLRFILFPRKYTKIPSFCFYHMLGTANDLPVSFWPFIQFTQIHTIYLDGCSINTPLGNFGVELLAPQLPGSKIKEISLTGNEIGSIGAKALAKHVPGTNITKLHLMDNKIGDAGAKALAEHLQGTNIQYIDLCANEIGNIGAKALARHLHGTKINTINLDSNNIGLSGATAFGKHLKGTNVVEIGLALNDIDGESAIALTNYLQGTKVKKIDLTENSIGSAASIKVIKNLQSTKVQNIRLAQNNIDDAGVKAFAKHFQGTNLHKINLFGNKIGDAGANALAKYLQGTTIKRLNLDGNKITDAGVETLVNHLISSNMLTIQLSYNKCSNKELSIRFESGKCYRS